MRVRPRMRRAIVTGVLSIALAPASAAAMPGILPPLELELGTSLIAAPDGGAVPATLLLVGVSWASLSPEPTRVDVTAGVIATFADERDVERGAVSDGTGGYLDLAYAVVQRPHLRAWLGGRGELMSAGDVGVLGGAVRASAEVWRGVFAAGSGAGIGGTLAFAVWVELGARERPDRSIAPSAAAGLGLRLPLILAR